MSGNDIDLNSKMSDSATVAGFIQLRLLNPSEHSSAHACAELCSEGVFIRSTINPGYPVSGYPGSIIIRMVFLIRAP